MTRILSILVVVALLLSYPAQAQSVQTPYIGMWIGAEELAALPTSGAAWNAVKAAADKANCAPKLANQDDNCDQLVMAAALVYARTGNAAYRTTVLKALAAIQGTEDGGRTLALARNLLPYVIAADLVNLPADADANTEFVRWLSGVRRESLDGRTLISTHEDRPNNWGTHAGASRIAAALYLGDETDLDRAAQVFRGWTGERASYSGFEYGGLDWQCDEKAPVGVNPEGCVKNGIDIDGAQPEEMRRGGTLQNPPKATGYAWEALQGAVVQMVLLERAGYGASSYGDRAVLRSVAYLYRIGWEPQGDDTWLPWVVNSMYGTTFRTTSPTVAGKNLGFADWTHAGRAGNPGPVLTATPRPTETATVVPSPAPDDAVLLNEIRGLRTDIQQLVETLNNIFR